MKITENEFNEALSDVIKSLSDDVMLPDSSLLSTFVDEPLDSDYVMLHDDELTEKYDDLLSAYGYDSFSGLYLAAKADFATSGETVESRETEAEKSASKNKDVSKLRLVQRTVMRRGKPTTLSFYEDPNKGEKKTEADNPPKKQDREQEADYTGFYTSGDKFGEPRENITSLLPPEDWYVVGSTKGKLYDCLYFVKGTEFEVVAGVKKVGNLLTLSFVATPNKESYQLGLYRSLKKLVSLIYSENYVGKDLGFTYKPHQDEEDLCKILFDYYNIKERQGSYEQKDLSKSLGKRIWIKW